MVGECRPSADGGPMRFRNRKGFQGSDIRFVKTTMDRSVAGK
jgi:hypothetical protein